MSDPYYVQQLREETEANDTPRLYEGLVVNSPNPGDGLLVTLPDFDDSLQYGPMPYSPRQDAEPAPGMACLIALSSAGQFWCVQYWPDTLVDPTVASGILSGHGSPSAGLGRDGSFYVNIDTSDLYGPKVGLVWGSPVNLVGPTGPTGPSGPGGSTGPQGIQGVSGPQGARGAGGFLEGWRIVGAAGQPAFVNSYTNYASPYGPVRFRKNAFGLVEVQGLAANGNVLGSGGAIFTLPAGYAPDQRLLFWNIGNNAGGDVGFRLDVDTSGNIILNAGSASAMNYISCCMIFTAANPPTNY